MGVRDRMWGGMGRERGRAIGITGPGRRGMGSTTLLRRRARRSRWAKSRRRSIGERRARRFGERAGRHRRRDTFRLPRRRRRRSFRRPPCRVRIDRRRGWRFRGLGRRRRESRWREIMCRRRREPSRSRSTRLRRHRQGMWRPLRRHPRRLSHPRRRTHLSPPPSLRHQRRTAFLPLSLPAKRPPPKPLPHSLRLFRTLRPSRTLRLSPLQL